MHKVGVCFLYDLYVIANRIKFRARIQRVKIGIMLEECDIGVNAISEMSKGRQLSSISLARIADYLDCSVDYLLGRTDKPEVNR